MCKLYPVPLKKAAKNYFFDDSLVVEAVVGFIKLSFVVIIFFVSAN